MCSPLISNNVQYSDSQSTSTIASAPDNNYTAAADTDIPRIYYIVQ